MVDSVHDELLHPFDRIVKLSLACVLPDIVLAHLDGDELEARKEEQQVSSQRNGSGRCVCVTD